MATLDFFARYFAESSVVVNIFDSAESSLKSMTFEIVFGSPSREAEKNMFESTLCLLMGAKKIPAKKMDLCECLV